MRFCSICSTSYDKCACLPRNIDAPQEEPPMKEKIVSFSKSLVAHAGNLFRSVDNPLQKKRLQICSNCEFFNAEKITCNKCGCLLIVKTSWASESCPEGKWSSQERRKINKNDCGCSKKDKN